MAPIRMLHYMPRICMHWEAAADIRSAINAPNRAEADRQLRLAVAKDRSSAPQLAQWMEENLPEGLIVFDFPASHRRRLRTTNLLERLNQEIKRRPRVATLFSNVASLLEFVSAVLIEICEESGTGKVYLSLETDSTPPKSQAGCCSISTARPSSDRL